MNGLQNIIRTGLTNGLHNGLNKGMSGGLRGEISDMLVYDLKNCTFWLDPTDIAGVNNLGRISSWKDKISNFNYNISSAQPRLILQDSIFNNQPVIDFDSINRGLRISTGPMLDLRTTTLVMVYRYQSPSTGGSYQSRVISDGDQSSSRNAGYSYLWNKSNNSNLINLTGFYQPGNIGNLVTSASLYNTNKYVMVINVNLWLANSNIISTNLTSVPQWRINALGGDAASYSGIWKLGEILLFRKLFTLDEATYITNRLNQKYNIF
jgi:hypothetical protein